MRVYHCTRTSTAAGGGGPTPATSPASSALHFLFFDDDDDPLSNSRSRSSLGRFFLFKLVISLAPLFERDLEEEELTPCAAWCLPFM